MVVAFGNNKSIPEAQRTAKTVTECKRNVGIKLQTTDLVLTRAPHDAESICTRADGFLQGIQAARKTKASLSCKATSLNISHHIVVKNSLLLVIIRRSSLLLCSSGKQAHETTDQTKPDAVAALPRKTESSLLHI